NEVKAITLTTIFEASALNRDEKIGGNIPSIKKLTRFGNKTFSYLSKVAIRHYLFETLNRLYGDDWKPADCIESGGRDQRVVQFDITKQNIFSHAELDAFGYMFTISGQQGINRKGCVGITKAVALEPWEGDMQFNANHDLARRCDATQNPVNKEEHMSYFKITFTIDVERLGRDEWLIEEHKYDNNSLTLIFNKRGEPLHEAFINNVTKIADNNFEVRVGDYRHKIEIANFGRGEKKKVLFVLDERLKAKRICQILNAIKNGLIYHSSGESWGIVPHFIIAGALKLPVPVFHSFVELDYIDTSVLENEYIIQSHGKKMIYIFRSEKFKRENRLNNLPEDTFYTKWENFLQVLGLF
ncbi:MAG: type I-B CRISPR-associated protein Cas7/Cst2/DevR, partial [Caldimicrobium sp.]